MWDCGSHLFQCDLGQKSSARDGYTVWVLVSILSTTGTGRVAEMVDPHCAHILGGGAANKQLAPHRRKAREPPETRVIAFL